MKRKVDPRILAAAVLVLLLIVGGIFVLIAKLIGDDTTDQEGVLSAPFSSSRLL